LHGSAGGAVNTSAHGKPYCRDIRFMRHMLC